MLHVIKNSENENSQVVNIFSICILYCWYVTFRSWLCCILIFLDRIHVIDSLPNVWMLDGRIVTCKLYILYLTYPEFSNCLARHRLGSYKYLGEVSCVLLAITMHLKSKLGRAINLSLYLLVMYLPQWNIVAPQENVFRELSKYPWWRKQIVLYLGRWVKVSWGEWKLKVWQVLSKAIHMIQVCLTFSLMRTKMGFGQAFKSL